MPSLYVINIKEIIMEQRRDKQKYEETVVNIFRTTYSRLFKQAVSMLGEEEEARDIVSSVFADILVKQISIDKINLAYLMASVRNKCIDVIRHRNIEHGEFHEFTLLDDGVDIVDDDMRIEEMQNFIDDELTPQTRRILQMCYVDQLSYKEVAKELDISVNTVNKHISRAMRMLRRHFGLIILVVCILFAMAVAAAYMHFHGAFQLKNPFGAHVESAIEQNMVTQSKDVVFENAELQVIVHTLSVNYDVNIVCSSEEQKNVRLHFRYNPSEDVNFVVERLNMFDKINVSITKK